MVPFTSSARARTLLSMGESLPASPVFFATSSTRSMDSFVQSEILSMSPHRARRGSSKLASSFSTPGGQT